MKKIGIIIILVVSSIIYMHYWEEQLADCSRHIFNMRGHMYSLKEKYGWSEEKYDSITEAKADSIEKIYFPLTHYLY